MGHIVKGILVAAALLGVNAPEAAASLFVTEIVPWGSVSPYGADWFELTNAGASAVDLTGWRMDDDSYSFALGAELRGVTSIAPGQSVIFLEGAATAVNDLAIGSNFKSSWFGSAVPPGLTVGFYGGPGVSLAVGGDTVNIYDHTGTLRADITFLSYQSRSPQETFDNSTGLNGVTFSEFSVAGVNQAFTSADGTAIGSPGFAAVPEPEEYAVLAGLAALAYGIVRRRNRPIPATSSP
jgi:hypothetical protein